MNWIFIIICLNYILGASRNGLKILTFLQALKWIFFLCKLVSKNVKLADICLDLKHEVNKIVTWVYESILLILIFVLSYQNMCLCFMLGLRYVTVRYKTLKIPSKQTWVVTAIVIGRVCSSCCSLVSDCHRNLIQFSKILLLYL